jgi:hypothetical protein
MFIIFPDPPPPISGVWQRGRIVSITSSLQFGLVHRYVFVLPLPSVIRPGIHCGDALCLPCCAAFRARQTRFVFGELVRATVPVRGASPRRREGFLFIWIHRRESARPSSFELLGHTCSV